MAAPKLVHYTSTSHATANTAAGAAPVPAAGRALVIAKITVVVGAGGTPTPVTFSLGVGSGSNTDPSFHIANGVTLAAGEVYTESGIILVAGDLLFSLASVSSGIRINVFGEEVDN